MSGDECRCCSGMSITQRVLLDAINECDAQDKRWGQQDHDPITWTAVLTEEVGEFAKAAMHERFGGPEAATLRQEAVQVAAVALQIVACLDRQAADEERPS